MTNEKEFRMRLAYESTIETHPIELDMDGSIEKNLRRALKRLKKNMDEEAYQEWKEGYLNSEYEKTKDYNWVTIHYLFAGIGDYAQTVPDSQKQGVYSFVHGAGSGFLGETVPATEEEIRNTLAMFADRGIELEADPILNAVSMRWGYDEGGAACGPVEGNTITEIMFNDDDGCPYFVSATRMLEYVNVYVSEVSLYDLLFQMTGRSANTENYISTIEKYALKSYDIEIDDYDEVEESDFFDEIKLVLFMNDQYAHNVYEGLDPEEWLEDYLSGGLEVELPE